MAPSTQQPVKPNEIDYGSLANTLNPAGVFSLQQAAEAQYAADLQRRSQEATQQAQQAQGALQQAAAAPPPDIGGAGLIPSLFGNVASVLAGNQRYGEEANQSIATTKASLLRARAENLSALHDVYLQKAGEAEKANDLETTEKYRVKAENLNKALLQVNANVERQDKKDAQDKELKAAYTRAVLGEHMDPRSGHGNEPFVRLPDKPDFSLSTGAGSSTTPPIGRLITLEGPDGEVAHYYSLEGATGDPKNAGLIWANQHGVPVLNDKEQTIIKDIQGAKDNAIEVVNQGLDRGFFADSATQRAVKGPMNWLKQQIQAKAPMSAYNTWRNQAIKALRATAGSGGLRINQQEIDLAIKNDLPLITDTREVAIQKMANIQSMLANAMRPYLTSDWRRMGDNSVLIGARLPRRGKIEMMDPDGKHWMVDVGSFRNKQAQGWARVMSTQAPVVPQIQQGNGTSTTSTTKIHMSGTPGAYGPPTDQQYDDLITKHLPKTGS